MKLDSLTLPGATYALSEAKKMVKYEYLFSDTNAVLETGLGISTIGVSGVCKTSTERDNIQQACQSTGIKKLKFPSAAGASDDRYYNVKTGPIKYNPIEDSANHYSYSFECYAADTTVYLVSGDTAVW